MKTINFVVIGYGGMGSYHAKGLIQEKDGVKVVGVYDIDQKRLDLAEEEGFKVYATLEDVVGKNTKIGAVSGNTEESNIRKVTMDNDLVKTARNIGINLGD